MIHASWCSMAWSRYCVITTARVASSLHAAILRTSMKYLGHPQAELETAGGIWTAREISQQPAVWPKIQSQLNAGAGALRAFLRPLLERKDLRIVLTGAGTSAFIGECLAPALKHSTGLRVDAVATTDLVGSPDTCLDESVPTLLVSFARSGNSPESLAA